MLHDILVPKKNPPRGCQGRELKKASWKELWAPYTSAYGSTSDFILIPLCVYALKPIRIKQHSQALQ